MDTNKNIFSMVSMNKDRVDNCKVYYKILDNIEKEYEV